MKVRGLRSKPVLQSLRVYVLVALSIWSNMSRLFLGGFLYDTAYQERQEQTTTRVLVFLG